MANQAQLLARREDYKTSHILHLLLSVITCGFWIPVWFLVAITNSAGRARIDRQLAR